MKSLEQYLRECFAANVIDHSIRADVRATGEVTCYIHPATTGGDTLDFLVSGNRLQESPFVTRPNDAPSVESDLESCKIEKGVAERRLAATETALAAAQREVGELRAAFAPVLDWYNGDGEITDLAAMLANAVEDLQADRQHCLSLEKTRDRLQAEVERLRKLGNSMCNELGAFCRDLANSFREQLQEPAAPAGGKEER